MQLALEGEDGLFLAALLELLADVAAASPGLFAGLRSEVAGLFAEDDPQLSVAAARMLAAAGAAMRSHSPGAVPPLSPLWLVACMQHRCSAAVRRPCVGAPGQHQQTQIQGLSTRCAGLMA